MSVPEEAITAAAAEVPDTHLGFIGGWKPAISRDCVERMLEAAAPHMTAIPQEAIRAITQAVTSERERIRQHAMIHRFVLYRPANGPGAGQQAMEAVPLVSLLEVL